MCQAPPLHNRASCDHAVRYHWLFLVSTSKQAADSLSPMLQEQRSEVLWRALERAIPDVRDRVKLKLVRAVHKSFVHEEPAKPADVWQVGCSCCLSYAACCAAVVAPDMHDLQLCAGGLAPDAPALPQPAQGVVRASNKRSIWQLPRLQDAPARPVQVRVPLKAADM